MRMSLEAKIITGVAVVIGVAVIGVALLFGEKPLETLSDTSSITRDYSYRLGAPTSKVTLVEFADFQCPACAALYEPLKKLMAEYDQTPGQVSFVYRHFPLPSHNHAQTAALAAEAAGKQGKFWEMQGKIYENQQRWSSKSDPQPEFEKLASEIGLNIEEFQKSVADKEFLTQVRQDSQDGTKLEVNSTPTLFINGQKYTGTLNYNSLKKAVEDQLKIE